MSMWVSPTFGASSSNPSSDPKRNMPGRSDGKLENPGSRGSVTKPFIWSDRYEPSSKEELAVNPKKIRELEMWLTSALSGKLGVGPIAVLGGPSGSGKTTTLKVLSRHMSFEIKEWVTPTGSGAPFYSTNRGYDCSASSPSQLMIFEDFLFRASRYSNLCDVQRKCVLLVEDVPNVLLHDPSLVEKTLQKYSRVAKSPLIFICSNTSTDFNLERILFKPKVQNDLKITNISFNQISKTLMLKALQRVSNLVKKDFPSDFDNSYFPVDETIGISSNDIRFSINHLQFRMTGQKDSGDVEQPKVSGAIRRKQKGVKPAAPDYVLGKDPPADVFRSLGRVLYCKKELAVDKNTNKTIEKLVYDPDEIVSKMSSAPGLFLGLMVENYLSIMNDIKNISVASDLLAQTDIHMSNYSERDSQVYFGLSVSVLGLMNLSSTNIQKKWCPFKGSRSREVIASCRERENRSKVVFSNATHDSRTLLTEVCPFYSQMGMPGLNLEQKKFVQEVVHSKTFGISGSIFLEEGSDGASCSASTEQVDGDSEELEPLKNDGEELCQMTFPIDEDDKIDIEGYSSDD